MEPPFPLQMNNFKNIYFYRQKLSRVSFLSQDWTKTLWSLKFSKQNKEGENIHVTGF